MCVRGVMGTPAFGQGVGDTFGDRIGDTAGQGLPPPCPGWPASLACGCRSLPAVAILHSVFVISLSKMALLLADQVYPAINKTLAVIGCDSSAAAAPSPGPSPRGNWL